MDIGGVNRLKTAAVVLEKVDTDRTRLTHSDRDPQGQQQHRDQVAVKKLTQEQEVEALEKLNAQSDFVKAGLKAMLVREEGIYPYIVVKKMSGEEVRRLPYEQVINIFLEKKDDSAKGLLFKLRA
jgi:uncharacterized FlaG/YvyC family protein